MHTVAFFLFTRFPAGHAAHDIVELFVKVPGSHSMQLVLPTSITYEPKKHCLQFDWPFPTPYRPAAQKVHPTTPGAVFICPLGHFTHCSSPSSSVVFPAAQARQAVPLRLAMKVPTEQFTQACHGTSVKLPGMHMVHALPASSTLYWPGWQLSQ